MSTVTQAMFNEFVKHFNSTNSTINQRIVNLEDKLNRLYNDFIGLYDLFYAHDKIKKSYGMSINGIHAFVKKNLRMDFNEMTPDLKINSLLQYIEASTNHSPQIYNKFIVESFRNRNKIAPLPNHVSPQKGDFAMVSWQLSDENGVVLVPKQEYAAYLLGSNVLLVDEQIMAMAAGESKEMDVQFPQEHSNKMLAGKNGKLSVSIHSFERSIAKMEQNLSEEEKKKVWKDKYEAHTIE